MNEYVHPTETVSSGEDYLALKKENQGRPRAVTRAPVRETANGAFLPSDYEAPTGPSNYMRLGAGENRLRILDNPVVGYEWWVDEQDGNRKPRRVHVGQRNPADSKHFWAMPVWNYSVRRVQILEITQKSIQRALRALAEDREWGSPLDYDVAIFREGEGRESRYQVVPVPHTPLDQEIRGIFAGTTVDLEALFDGKDPFVKEVNR